MSQPQRTQRAQRTRETTGRGESDPLSRGERDRVRGKETLNPPRRQTNAGFSTFEQVQAVVVYNDSFPLTPALSLGERENDPLRRVMLGALGIVEHRSSVPPYAGERDRVRGENAPSIARALRLGTVTQTGSLLYRGLAIRSAQGVSSSSRLPVGDTAGCQPTLRAIRGDGRSMGNNCHERTQRTQRVQNPSRQSLRSLRSFAATFPVRPSHFVRSIFAP